MSENQEHPTPECPYCQSTKTRPLDDTVATCFNCDAEFEHEYVMVSNGNGYEWVKE